MSEISIWTIAGFDPSGGAGILADRQVFTAATLSSQALISAHTAQNAFTVTRVVAADPQLFADQLEALRQQSWPTVIKVGLLPTTAMVRCVSELLESFPGKIIYDPVMVASSGSSLMKQEALAALKEYWLPKVSILTPNIAEASCLSGMPITNTAQMQVVAYALCQAGIREIIIKGGHLDGDFAQDIWCDGKSHCWLTLPRLKVPALHGSGCIFSAALACAIAMGENSQDAFVYAKMRIQQALHEQHVIRSMQDGVEYFPWLTDTAHLGQHRLAFAPLQQPLKFYTIINNAAWLAKLQSFGVKAWQLRFKTEDKGASSLMVKEAISISQQQPGQLFINDDWQAALSYGAYGVHLGQEDLAECDLQALQAAGLRLGVSTHSLSELARAKALQPSYIAFGPIYQTTTKVMSCKAQGLEKLQQWRNWVSEPLIAIGGIKLNNLAEVLACGVDGVAVISAVTKARDPLASCQAFLSHFQEL